jgi:Anti-sigma-K factor rskA
LNAQEIISSGILELYCMELTTAAETAEVKQWALQYPEVAAEIEAIRSGLESYAQSHAITPAASVKEKIFAEINKGSATPVVDIPSNDRPAAKLFGISPVWKYAAAASILLLIGSLVFNYTYYNKYNDASQELATTKAELQQQVASAQSMDSAMRIMGNIDAMPVAVKSIDSATNMGARIYWVKNTNEVYIDPANLPAAPQGKQYEFWAIVDGAPVNGGVITTEINGRKVHVQKMKSFGQAQAFAISLEDAGPAKTKPDKVMAVGSL